MGLWSDTGEDGLTWSKIEQPGMKAVTWWQYSAQLCVSLSFYFPSQILASSDRSSAEAYASLQSVPCVAEGHIILGSLGIWLRRDPTVSLIQSSLARRMVESYLDLKSGLKV